MIDTAKLAYGTLNTLRNVLVHQLERISALHVFEHGFEGWWKVKFLTALNSYSFSSDYDNHYQVRPEQNPKTYGIEGDFPDKYVDIMVGPWSEGEKTIIANQTPRVWVEIKTATAKKKDFTSCINQLKIDLVKWSNASWDQDDVVISCLVLLYYSSDANRWQLPSGWLASLDEVSQSYPRFLPNLRVACPAFDQDDPRSDVCVSIDFFTIHGSQFIHKLD